MGFTSAKSPGKLCSPGSDLRIKPRKSWRGAAVAVACLALSGNVLAQDRSGVVVPVFVYNYGRVPSDTLQRALRHANRAFEISGVSFQWHTCRTDLRHPQKSLSCASGIQPTDLILKVLSESHRPAFGLANDVAGFVPAGYGVSDAFAFYDRLHNIGIRESTDEAIFLGLVIAHELGHILMGPASHSASGLMRPEWPERFLITAKAQTAQFSAEQCQRIRLGAMARKSPVATFRGPESNTGH